MSSGSHDLVLFLGRFHPVLVHLPIGGLVLLGVLELLAKLPRFKDAAQSNRLILGLTAAASVTAALLGWMLSQAGGYDPQLLPWHKWTGFAVAAACTADLAAELAGLAPGVSDLPAGDARRAGRRQPPGRLDHSRARLPHPVCARRPCAPCWEGTAARRPRPGTTSDLTQRRGVQRAHSADPRSGGAQPVTARRSTKPICPWRATKPCSKAARTARC